MKLEKKYNQNNGEYYCELTRELDELCGYAATNPRYKHYIYDTRDLWDNELAIRVPGKTTGGIQVDKNNAITRIAFGIGLSEDTKQYPDDIYREMEKYIGVALEI